jgi:hypothetical protein
MLHSNIRATPLLYLIFSATMGLYPFLDVTVYIYWRKRNNKNAPPTLDAYLYEGKREGGRVKTKNIGYERNHQRIQALPSTTGVILGGS